MKTISWILLLLSAGFSASAAELQKVRVTGSDAVLRLEQAGGRMLAEYESFSIMEADAAAVQALGDAAEVLENDNRILLNAGVVDTSLPATKSLRARTSLGKGRALHLVQFVGPVQPAWHDALVSAGFQIVDFIPENAYLVYGDTAALAKLRALPASRWRTSSRSRCSETRRPTPERSC